MMMLISGFIAILAVTFGVMMLAASPSRDAKRVEQRIAVIQAGTARIDGMDMDATSLLRASSSDRFGWLDTSFQKYPLWKNLQRFVMQSGVNSNASAVLVQSAAMGVIGLLTASIVYPEPSVEIIAACVMASLPWIRIAWARSRRLKAFNKDLPEAIDMMARALRAGHAISGAIEMAGDSAPPATGKEFAEVFRQQNFGLPLREALLQLLERVPSPDLRVLITAILVQRETGGNLVEVMDRTVFLIRERQRIQGEIKVQTAQGRLTGWILSLMPIGLMGILNIIDPGYSKILLTDPFGRKLCYVGLGLIVLGGLIIRQIVNGVDV
ncbi:MAG: type II secretion system F family protein [Silvibacterium sp.]|nr:type II secretion system F family protein [Silvibacterium sp.]